MGKNRKKRLLKIKVFLGFLLLFLPSLSLAQEESALEKAREAIRKGAFQTAIDICRSFLKSNPEDLDVIFVLAQAEAFSGNHDEALNLCNKILDREPDYHDAVILKARLHFWKKDYLAARKLLESLLEKQPENHEALKELGRIAEARFEYAYAQMIYEKLMQKKLPEKEEAEICWRLGRLYLAENQTGKATELFKKAAFLDPENNVYRDALKNLMEKKEPPAEKIHKNKRKEVWFQYRLDDYSEQPQAFHAGRLFFLFQPASGLTLIPRFGLARYYERTDYLIGIEAYPKLWKQAYACVDLNFSEPAHSFPRTSSLVEIYQGLLKNFELSLGYWFMKFPLENVYIYLTSLAYYHRSYYFLVRGYYIPLKTGKDFSWVAQGRKYFGSENYLYLSFGSGSRPFEINSIGDLAFVHSTMAGAGFKIYLSGRLLLEGHFSWLKEKSGPRRSSLTLATGYRF